MNKFNKTKIVEEYFDVLSQYTKKYGDKTVVLFQVGAFYEVYGIDNTKEKIGNVSDLSNILNVQKTRANKKIIESSLSNPELIGFPINSLDKYLSVLIENYYTVVIYDQEKTEKTEIKGKKIRSLLKIVSPSTYIEDNNFNIDNTNILICLYLEFKKNYLVDIGLSYIDLSLGRSECIIVDHLLNKENISSVIPNKIYDIIRSLNPKEIIISTNNSEFKFIKDNDIFNVHTQEINKEYIKISYQTDFLNKIFKNSTMLSIIEYLELESYPSTIISFITLLTFANEHNINLLNKILKPTINKFINKLELSNGSIYQLNILSPSFKTKSKNSLLNLINNTSTSMGYRLLKYTLLNPTFNKETLERSYNDTENLLIDNKFLTYEKYLKNIKDIDKLRRKINLLTIQPHELVDIIISVKNALELINHYSNNEGFIIPGFHLIKNIDKLKTFIEYCESQLKIDNITNFNLDNKSIDIFNDGLYPKIDNLRVNSKNLWNEFNIIKKELNDIIEEKDAIKIEFTNTHGYHFVVSKKRSELLKKKNCNYKLTIKTQTSVAKIFCNESNDISDKIILNKEKLQSITMDIYNKFLDKINKQYNITLKSICDFISYLDLIKSNAKTASINKYCKPIIQTTNLSFLKVEKLRHAIVEQVTNNIKFIPNDIDIKENGMLIYGTNYSGKSVYIKSVAIAIILAQSGFYVPAEKFVYNPFETLITKIVTEDNIYKSQSTFVCEMNDLKNILNNCNNKSMIIADELCNSTEYYSGMAIVSSTIKELINKKANYIFTSHFHKIINLPILKDIISSKNNLNVYHMSVDIKDGNFIFNRKLIEGEGSEIYGIEIAKHLNVGNNTDFIKDAISTRNYLTEQNTDILSIKKSRYNNGVYVDECKICKSIKELQTHHIVFQSEFKTNLQIPFNKNIKHNLIVLCEECHQKVHTNKIKINGYIQTSLGIELDIVT